MSIKEIEIIKCCFQEAVASFRGGNKIEPYLTDVEAQGLEQYLEILKLWNKKIDLVSPQSDEMLIGKHLIDSAVVSRFITNNLTIRADCCYIDVGSGAGFPGAVLGLFEQDRKVYLIEPREKRCFFLREIKRQLKLENVKIICSRVEDFAIPTEPVGVVTNRALGMRDGFLKEAGRFLAADGYVVELLTPEGMKKCDNLAKTLSYALPPDNSGRVVAAYLL